MPPEVEFRPQDGIFIPLGIIFYASRSLFLAQEFEFWV